MRQATAFWLILLYDAMADGIADAFGMGVFLAVGAVVLAVDWVLIQWGRVADEVHTD